MADLIQWVNLPKKNAFVEDDIKSELRLGAVKLKARFKTDDLANCKIRLVADGADNIEYSDKEIARWKRYKKLPIAFAPRLNDSKKEVEFNGEFELPAAGANKYKFEVLYKGKVKATTKSIEAKRRMFFEVVPMEGVTPPDKSSFEKELNNIFDVDEIVVECKEIGGRTKKISNKKTIITDADFVQIDNELASSVMSTDHKPYVIPITFVDYIADHETIDVTQDVEIGLKRKFLSYIGLREIYVTVKIKTTGGSNRYLFYNFDDEMDKNKTWLESCRIEDENGRVMGRLTSESIVDQNLLGIKFKIDTDLGHFLSKKIGKVKLKVKVVDSITNGYAWHDSIVIALKNLKNIEGDREGKVPADYMPIIMHEVGHVFKQAATGDCPQPPNPAAGAVTFLDSSSPDSHADLYGQYHENCGPETNSYGHQGPHCKNGASYSAANAEWTGAAGCFMFGSDELGNPSDFCSNCKKTLRKADLYKV